MYYKVIPIYGVDINALRATKLHPVFTQDATRRGFFCTGSEAFMVQQPLIEGAAGDVGQHLYAPASEDRMQLCLRPIFLRAAL